VVELARKKRHLHLIERLHAGKALSKSELDELKEFESPTSADDVKKKDGFITKKIPELAKALDCTARTVRNWISEGMPVRADKTYDIEAIRAWRRERDNRRKPSEKEAYETKILKARLRNLELEHQEKMAKLVSREEVDRRNVAKIIAVKRELLALPRALAKQLEHQEARRIEAILQEKINGVILKFSGQDQTMEEQENEIRR